MIGRTQHSKLGEAYASGIGIPQDYFKAKEWLEKSISEEDAESYYQPALLYGFKAFGNDESGKEFDRGSCRRGFYSCLPEQETLRHALLLANTSQGYGSPAIFL